MAAPNSPVAICNLALDHLGQAPIASIEKPETQSETILARHYDMVRRALLRQYVWNFAKKRAVLARTSTPAFDYEDAYKLPTGCLRVLSINGDFEVYQDKDYDLEGREILYHGAGANSIQLRYIQDVTTVQEWDSLFIELMTLALALSVAYKFTLKKGVLDSVNKLYAEAIPKAVTVDGQEVPPKVIQRSKYLSARRRGTQTGVAGIYTVFR